MLLKKKELLICLCARGYENAVAAEETLPDMDEQSRQSLKTALAGLGLLESDPQVEGGYRFSAFGQVILDTIGKPDVLLEADHLKRNIRRSLYLRDAFYVCVEEMDEDVMIDLLPSLPIFIGGYASLLKELRGAAAGEATQADWKQDDQLIRVSIGAAGKTVVMEIDEHGVTRQTDADGVTFKRHTQESGTNAITMWMLNALKQIKEKTT